MDNEQIPTTPIEQAATERDPIDAEKGDSNPAVEPTVPKGAGSASKAKSKLWISLTSIAVCVIAVVIAIVVLLTPASESIKHIIIDNNGVTDGVLVPKLVRERLDTKTLDKRGLAVVNSYTDEVDFSAPNELNVFGMDGDILVGPGCYFTAHMAISNTEPYDFSYSIQIVPKDGKTLLSDQIKIVVVADGQTIIDRVLGDGLTTKTLPAVTSGNTSRFSVRMEYLDLENNNDTQGATLAFDMAVRAALV